MAAVVVGVVDGVDCYGRGGLAVVALAAARYPQDEQRATMEYVLHREEKPLRFPPYVRLPP